MNLRQPALLPFCDSACPDKFSFAGQVGGNTEPCSWPAGGQYGFQQLVIPVRRLDEDLGGTESLRVCLKVAKGFGSLGLVYGQVPYKPELLPIHAAGHQCQQDRAGAYQGSDSGACLVGSLRQQLTGIGDTGATGLTDDADGLTFFQCGSEYRPDLFLCLVNRMPLIIVDHHLLPQGFQVSAGAAFVFHKKHLARLHRIQYIGGQGGQRMLVQVGWYQVDGRWHIR